MTVQRDTKLERVPSTSRLDTAHTDSQLRDGLSSTSTSDLLTQKSTHSDELSTSSESTSGRQFTPDLSELTPIEPTTRSPKQVARIPEEKFPRVGVEQELTSTQLKPRAKTRHGKQELFRNGIELARSSNVTGHDLPWFKLETEGADRKSLCIELVEGPFLADVRGTRNYQNAKAALYDALKGARSVHDVIQSFNAKVPGAWKLQPSEFSDKYSLKSGSDVKGNFQTNISVDYNQIGAGSKGFREAFSKRTDLEIYDLARDQAEQLAKRFLGHEQTTTPESLDGVQALLTHIMSQELIVLLKMTPTKSDKSPQKRTGTFGDKQSKHHFHVLYKASPEDAVMSVLSDSAVEYLHSIPEGELVQAVRKTVRSLHAKLASGGRGQLPDSERLEETLHKAVRLRREGGRQSLSTGREAKDGQSAVYNRAGQQIGTLKHSHPRPSARIPVVIRGSRPEIVAEIRNSDHPLNAFPTLLTSEKTSFKNTTHEVQAKREIGAWKSGSTSSITKSGVLASISGRRIGKTLPPLRSTRRWVGGGSLGSTKTAPKHTTRPTTSSSSFRPKAKSRPIPVIKSKRPRTRGPKSSSFRTTLPPLKRR